MGNQSSSNKLSKPKTNTNSVAPPAKTDSPESSSASPVDLGPHGRQHIREALLSLLADEFDQHPRVQKKDSVIETTRTLDTSVSAASMSRSHSRSNSRSNSLSCFGSKHGSTAKLASMGDSKLSLVSGSHVDIAEAIKLLQQVKKNGSPEDIAALQQVLEMPEECAESAGEPNIIQRTSPIDRSSSASLTRRQSLIQTPGVGTRISPADGRRRTWNSWRAPKLEPDDEAKWRTKSHNAPQLAFPTPEAFPDITHDDPRPRVPSPTELDYSHLGSLKPGTLVVMNGPASPASSIRAPLRTHAEDEDYFSGAEPGASPLMMKTTRRRGHTRSQSAVLPGTSLSTVETVELQVPHEVVRRSSTVKLVECADEPLSTKSTAPSNPSNPAAQAMYSNANAPAHSFPSYQTNIVPSPSPVPEGDRTVNKYKSFTSDDTYYPTSDDTFVSQDLVLPPTVTTHSPPPSASPPAQKKPKHRAKQRPPPRTTDSGYSSNGSLPVDDQELQAGPSYRHCSQCQHHGVQRPRDTSKDQEAVQQGLAKQTQESVKTDLSPVSAVYAVPSLRSPIALTQTASATAESSRPNRSKSGLPISVNTTSSSSRSSIAEPLLSPQTPRSVSSKSSFNGTSGRPPKRLHRRRPSQAENLVVQSCQPIPEGHIPDVPPNVRAKFERRVSSTPGMDCLTQTYPSKDHVIADELKPEIPLPGHTEFSQLVELQAGPQPEPQPTPSAHGRRRSLSFFRRKSISDRKEAEEDDAGATSITADYLEHIGLSIGNSPYDAITCDLPRQAVPSPAYPHQPIAPFHRSKSMVEMDRKVAAQLVHAYSKDFVATEEVLPQRRRKSFHSLSPEAGEARVLKHRPQNSDIPPVPTIDMTKLSASRSGMPQANKRHSIGATAPSPPPRARTRQRSQTVCQPDSKSKSTVAVQKPTQQGMQWDQHPQVNRQRRKTIAEGTRPVDFVTAANRKHPSLGAGPKPLRSENAATWGRYSGGLGYEYEGRSVGVGGSAGTRQVNSCATVKSRYYQHQYGVDLSDVPIIVQQRV